MLNELKGSSRNPPLPLNVLSGLSQFLARASVRPARRAARGGLKPAGVEFAGIARGTDDRTRKSSNASGGCQFEFRAGESLHSALHVGGAGPAGYVGPEAGRSGRSPGTVQPH